MSCDLCRLHSVDYTQLANTLTLTNSVILSNLSNATGTLVSLEDGVKMAGTKVGLILDVVSNTTLNLNYTSFECECSCPLCTGKRGSSGYKLIICALDVQVIDENTSFSG